MTNAVLPKRRAQSISFKLLLVICFLTEQFLHILVSPVNPSVMCFLAPLCVVGREYTSKKARASPLRIILEYANQLAGPPISRHSAA